jgi:hypothetical protein
MLKTKSQFLYGLRVVANDQSISFVEAATPSEERVATLKATSYSLTGLRYELQRALNESGNQDYTVTLNENDFTFTISAPLDFDILVSSGIFAGSSIWLVLGLGFSDLTGSNSYITEPLGILYRPQFYLLDYLDGRYHQRPIDSTKNETSSGIVEVVRYGTRYIYEMNIDFVTEIPQDPSGWIETDTNALTNLREFLEYCTGQGIVEFFADRDETESVALVLQGTTSDSNGLGFRLTEKPGLPDYYTTGLLTFRKV